MKRKITIMFIPEKGNRHHSFTFPHFTRKTYFSIAFVLISFFGYLCFDYSNLILQRNRFYKIQEENQNIKNEAQVLSQHLDLVKKSLHHVQEYARKINDMVQIKMNIVKNKTGFDPLSDVSDETHDEASDIVDSSYPLGINLEKLVFKPIFFHMNEVQQESSARALELENLISSLSQKKSILDSIPITIPVKGLITSGFGRRQSPFTGDSVDHRGIDIAAAVGTPIYAPADGVVVFSGYKQDFGKMVMIAHHDNKIVTKFAHNSENVVVEGQHVLRGDQIASVGMTGNTTGPHLHYEVWVRGQVENPVNFILDAEVVLF